MKKADTKGFYDRVRLLIKSIPNGRVSTYGQIAAYAGNRRAARQVAWVLHSCSSSDGLPWHRVINRKGKISLKRGYGYELQKTLLESEGIKFDKEDRVDLEVCCFHFPVDDSGLGGANTRPPS
jgi:methylated-DNA-protein-cysteine methyltransferase-like protein